MLKTPVLFLIYKRPDTTASVFEQIRKAKPRQLFVVADGPKDILGEKEACEEARKVALDVDWDCEVKTNFSDVNMGCRERVSSGISWFFEHVEEGIILEDDTVPDVSFFRYCEELLEKYRYDTRIFQLSGFNPVAEEYVCDKSYIFSKYGSIWGWATWKRAWSNYDSNISRISSFEVIDQLNKLPISRIEVKYREDLTIKVLNKEIDSWAVIWSYIKLSNSGISVVSANNIITNSGNKSVATNTTNSSSRLFDVKIGELKFPIKHPENILVDHDFDKVYFYNTKAWGKYLERKNIIQRVIRKIANKILERV